jgi:S-adenosylmethionine hydrolase
MGKLLAFLSDFGYADSYVAEVKGVIKSLAPATEIIDLTHGVEPGNLGAAAFILAGAYAYFPPGTLQLVVVDPGVGTERAILAIRTKRYTFVGPDNGVLYEAVRREGEAEIFALDPERFAAALRRAARGNQVIERITAAGISRTFHGRDVFAPLAAFLLMGRPLERLARRLGSMQALPMPEATAQGGRVLGRVLYSDRFGNLVTNIPASLLEPECEVLLSTRTGVVTLGKPRGAYAEAPEGSPLALVGSRGFLELAVNRGSAREHFGAGFGDEVVVLAGGRA